jgi:hypothetical protein
MNPRTDPEDSAWIDDDPVDCLDPDMDDDIFPEDFDDTDEEVELDFDAEPRPKYFTPRQRIEMVREEQWLQSLVADFEDFDQFESFDNTYVSELSH